MNAPLEEDGAAARTDEIPGKSSNNEEILGEKKKATTWKTKFVADISPEELIGLSKNQTKKLYKKRFLEETKQERRKNERERKKEKKKALKEAGIEIPRKMRLRDYKDIEYCNQRIVIDLDFFDLMAECDVRMVIKQVNRCYAMNRKAKHPLKLYASSFVGPIKDMFTELQPGSIHWDFLFEERHYLDAFPKDQIVYLTSDSDNVLESLDESKVYIIGGLVDHNNHKEHCLRKAIERGIGHCQLPIGKYVNMATRKVLTINHVFEIISKFLETKDWKESFFSVLPKRKRMTDKVDEGLDRSEEEEEKES